MCPAQVLYVSELVLIIPLTALFHELRPVRYIFFQQHFTALNQYYFYNDSMIQ